MDIEIIIDMLSKDSVSVRTQKYYVDGENIEFIGSPHREAFVNNVPGRDAVSKLGEPYSNSIFAVWGEEPTVFDEIENLEEEIIYA